MLIEFLASDKARQQCNSLALILITVNCISAFASLTTSFVDMAFTSAFFAWRHLLKHQSARFKKMTAATV
jgi:hypothetical protein